MSRLRGKQGRGAKPNRALRTMRYFPVIVMGAVTYLALLAVLAASVAPERHEVTVGEIAKRTITATKDVEDEITTQARRDAAANAAKVSFVADPNVQSEVMSDVAMAFIAMEAVRAEGERLTQAHSGDVRATALPAVTPLPTALGLSATGHDVPLLDESLLTKEVGNMMRMELGDVHLEDHELRALMGMSRENFNLLSIYTQRMLRESLAGNVTEGQEKDAVGKLERDLVNLYDIPPTYATIGAAVARAHLRANMIVNEEETENTRAKARESIEPLIYKKGQNVVVAGEVVTYPQYVMLQNLGMLKNDAVDVQLYSGLSLLLLLLFAFLGAYVALYQRDILVKRSSMTLLSVIVILQVLVCFAIRPLQLHLMPIALGALLIAMLLNTRLALICNGIFAVLLGLLASGTAEVLSNSMLSVVFTCFVSGSLGVLSVHKRQQHRGALLVAGLVVAVSNMATTLALGAVTSANMRNVFNVAGWAAGGGALAALIALGMQPILELAFNLLTPAKMLELSNPNQPLLKRLLMEAPGTYHHSIIVANLSEAAAESISANALLVRVGAYYHDVGKLRRPLYFKENQMGDNPHDRTDPRVSNAIVTAHPQDGVQLCQKYRIPAPIQEIVLSHHGTAPTMYFYHKATQLETEPVNIDDFRYPCPRPTSRESGIVMLADTVEAAVRSLNDPTPERIHALIRKLVDDKLKDGQLDECALTFADIDHICTAFMTVLTGVFHERIEYPAIDVPDRYEELPDMQQPRQLSMLDETDVTEPSDGPPEVVHEGRVLSERPAGAEDAREAQTPPFEGDSKGDLEGNFRGDFRGEAAPGREGMGEDEGVSVTEDRAEDRAEGRTEDRTEDGATEGADGNAGV